MTLGAQVPAGLIRLQVNIWIVSPNALENRMDHWAFGKKLSTGGLKNAKRQKAHLTGTLVEMGLRQTRWKSASTIRRKEGDADGYGTAKQPTKALQEALTAMGFQ